MLKYLTMISNDIFASSSYMSIAGIGGIIGAIFCVSRRKDRDLIHVGSWFLGCTYLVYVLMMTVIMREPMDHAAYQLGLFETLGATVRQKCYFIENILFFVPLGLLLPVMFEKLQKWYILTPTVMGISLIIELAQLISRRGMCQTDDLVANTIGGLIGFGCYLIFAVSERKNK